MSMRDLGVQVSRICVELDGEVAAFRSRSLAHAAFPYVFLDAIHLRLAWTAGSSAAQW